MNSVCYLTEKEVSEMLSLSLSTLRIHRMQGKGLPYVKFARTVRYKLSDVQEYLDSKTIQPRG